MVKAEQAGIVVKSAEAKRDVLSSNYVVVMSIQQ